MKLITQRELMDLLGKALGGAMTVFVQRNMHTVYKTKRTVTYVRGGLSVERTGIHNAYNVATVLQMMALKRDIHKGARGLWRVHYDEVVAKLQEFNSRVPI